jgi:serine protease
MNKYYRVVVFVLLLALVGSFPSGAGANPLQPSGATQDPGASVAADKLAALTAKVSKLPTNQIIIKYKASAAARLHPAQANEMLRLSQVAGVSLQYSRPMSGDAHVLRLAGKLPLDQVQVIAARLMTSPDVEYAEPDQIMYHTLDPLGIAPVPASRPLLLSPNDPQYSNQWGYSGTWGINAPAAWDVTTGSASVVVAVIDTGITSHAEFVGRTVPGYDFIGDTFVANDGDGRDSNPSDPGDWVAADECDVGSPALNSSWHGTHTAGTIGAAGNNLAGVAGINWSSKILPVRVLGKCGGYDSDIVDGMSWSAGLAVPGVPANANPAKVLSISLGGPGSCSATDQNAINAITAAGAVVVVAAGNSSADASGFTPANCNGVITVAATDLNGNMAYYSNYGTSVEISAPGGAQSFANDPNGILSTLNTGTTVPVADTYIYYQGTSMATPHVSGVVSLMFSVNPSLTPAQVLLILRSTAKAFPVSGTCTTSNCGSGIVNAGAAVNSAMNPPSIISVYLPLIRKDAPPAPTGPTPGYWQSSTGGMYFYVTADQTIVRKFTILVNLTGCGSYWIYRTIPIGDIAIGSNQFSSGGPFYASGVFSSSTAASGSTGLSSFGPVCGYYWDGGPWAWSATWQNSTHPTFMSAQATGSGFVQAAPETPSAYMAVPVK